MLNLLRISAATQTLECLSADARIGATRELAELEAYAEAAEACGPIYTISTAAAGLGELNGSLQTPRGWHYIRACIGRELPALAVLAGRRWTGEIFDTALAERYPQRDWILTRILWLCGLELGNNRGNGVDTQRRYIYIHGTADEHLLGTAASHGCIRMASDDVTALFERVQPGCRVIIR
ncbi:L,D-transpeptidase family protein [Allohahella sp. A8]|uniref:L,D-transpeptidase family protein n=1 Tax=Allohahella sp. A8 TaxID=3141461 RepID=UPI003A807DC5